MKFGDFFPEIINWRRRSIIIPIELGRTKSI